MPGPRWFKIGGPEWTTFELRRGTPEVCSTPLYLGRPLLEDDVEVGRDVAHDLGNILEEAVLVGRGD